MRVCPPSMITQECWTLMGDLTGITTQSLFVQGTTYVCQRSRNVSTYVGLLYVQWPEYKKFIKHTTLWVGGCGGGIIGNTVWGDRRWIRVVLQILKEAVVRLTVWIFARSDWRKIQTPQSWQPDSLPGLESEMFYIQVRGVTSLLAGSLRIGVGVYT